MKRTRTTGKKSHAGPTDRFKRLAIAAKSKAGGDLVGNLKRMHIEDASRFTAGPDEHDKESSSTNTTPGTSEESEPLGTQACAGLVNTR